MYDAPLIAEGHVRACQEVVGDCLAEDFDAEDVCDSEADVFASVGCYLLWGGERTYISSVSRSRSGWTCDVAS